MYRLTYHNAKKTLQTSAIHNGRNGKIKPHIDKTRTDGNYIYYGTDLSVSKDLKASEMEYYIKRYSNSLAKQNDRHIKGGHKERVKTMNDIYKNDRTKPVETILQIGDKDKQISAEEMYSIGMEFIKWQEEKFPNYHILDGSFHQDEATPHWHIRGIFDYKKGDGLDINMTGALKDMGIQRPDLSCKEGRSNNPKMTFDNICRTKLIEICKQHSIQIETEPLEKYKSLSVIEYKKHKELLEINKVKQDLLDVSRSLETKGITDKILNNNQSFDKKKYKKMFGRISLSEEEFDELTKILLVSKGINKEMQSLIDKENALKKQETFIKNYSNNDKFKEMVATKNKQIKELNDSIISKNNKLKEVDNAIDALVKDYKDALEVIEYSKKIKQQSAFDMTMKINKLEVLVDNYKRFIETKGIKELYKRYEKSFNTKGLER